jgi:hypothetical protein
MMKARLLCFGASLHIIEPFALFSAVFVFVGVQNGIEDTPIEKNRSVPFWWPYNLLGLKSSIAVSARKQVTRARQCAESQ